MQFSTGKHRLEHIACIHGTIRLTCAHNQMQFINKQDNLAFAVLHILQNCLQTFLKLTTVFGACYQCPHIQGKNLLILQSFRHISADNTLCQSFNYCCLTDTRFTDQHRIILGLPRQNPYYVTDLCISSNDRIHLLLTCLLYQFLAVLAQGIVGSFRIIGSHTLIASYRRQCLQKTFTGNAVLTEQFFDCPARMMDHRQKQMLNGDIFVSHVLCFIFGRNQYLIQIIANIWLTTGDLRPLLNSGFHAIDKILRLYLHLLYQLLDQTVFLIHQCI